MLRNYTWLVVTLFSYNVDTVIGDSPLDAQWMDFNFFSFSDLQETCDVV